MGWKIFCPVNLVCRSYRNEMMFGLQVDSKLVDLRESGMKNKSFLDGHLSSMGDIVTKAKRKWQAFCVQAEKDAKDTSDFSAARHCRMEVLMQQR